MTDHRKDTSTAAIIIGSVVIAVGAWLLLWRALGFAPPVIATYVRLLLSAIGPLALIGLGILVIVAANRGAFAGSRSFTGKRWTRSRDDRMVGGVLGGLGEFLEVDSTLLRLGYVLLAVATGFFTAIVIYVVALVVIPEAPLDATATTTAPPPPPPAPPAS